MPKLKNTCKLLLALMPATALGAVLFLSACGRKETAPLSEGTENSPSVPGAQPEEPPLNVQIEQKLDPLSKEDVQLYLQVMSAASKRIKNPQPSDEAALNGARKILAGSASRIPTPDDVKTLERANLVALAMDQIVAEEMKLDGRTYRGIAEAIEAVVPNPKVGPVPTAGEAAPREHPLTPMEARLKDVNEANQKFLKSYREEIQQLIAVVRNSANLPK